MAAFWDTEPYSLLSRRLRPKFQRCLLLSIVRAISNTRKTWFRSDKEETWPEKWVAGVGGGARIGHGQREHETKGADHSLALWRSDTEPRKGSARLIWSHTLYVTVHLQNSIPPPPLWPRCGVQFLTCSTFPILTPFHDDEAKFLPVPIIWRAAFSSPCWQTQRAYLKVCLLLRH
jgi:hypothetical protein